MANSSQVSSICMGANLLESAISLMLLFVFSKRLISISPFKMAMITLPLVAFTDLSTIATSPFPDAGFFHGIAAHLHKKSCGFITNQFLVQVNSSFHIIIGCGSKTSRICRMNIVLSQRLRACIAILQGKNYWVPYKYFWLITKIFSKFMLKLLSRKFNLL